MKRLLVFTLLAVGALAYLPQETEAGCLRGRIFSGRLRERFQSRERLVVRGAARGGNCAGGSCAVR